MVNFSTYISNSYFDYLSFKKTKLTYKDLYLKLRDNKYFGMPEFEPEICFTNDK